MIYIRITRKEWKIRVNLCRLPSSVNVMLKLSIVKLLPVFAKNCSGQSKRRRFVNLWNRNDPTSAIIIKYDIQFKLEHSYFLSQQNLKAWGQHLLEVQSLSRLGNNHTFSSICVRSHKIWNSSNLERLDSSDVNSCVFSACLRRQWTSTDKKKAFV